MSASLAHCRPARGNLPFAPALHVRVDLVDLRRIHAERAPRRHALRRAPRADRLDEQLLGIDRTVRLQGHDEVGRDGRPQHVLAVTPGAVQVVLLPPVVGRLIDGVPRRLMVRVAQRRLGGLRGGLGSIRVRPCCGWVVPVWAPAGVSVRWAGGRRLRGAAALSAAWRRRRFGGSMRAVSAGPGRRPCPLVGAAGAVVAVSTVATLPSSPAGAASRSPPQAATSSIARRLPQRVAGRPRAETSCQAEPIVPLPFPSARVVSCDATLARRRPPRPVTTVAG